MALVSIFGCFFYRLLMSPNLTRLVWWLTPVKITCMDHGETHFKSFQVWRFNTNRERNVGSQQKAAHPHISRFVHIEFHISAPEMCKGLVWNYKNKCSKTHLMLVQTKARLLYALEGMRYFWTSKIHTCARKNGFNQVSLSSRIIELRCVSDIKHPGLSGKPIQAGSGLRKSEWTFCARTPAETELRTRPDEQQEFCDYKSYYRLTEWATGQMKAQDLSGFPDKGWNGPETVQICTSMVKELSLSFKSTLTYLLSTHTLRMEHTTVPWQTCTVADGWKAPAGPLRTSRWGKHVKPPRDTQASD